jgi:diguanylate cyclase (GGDEF)-like protein/PAS domain S-box-containing protein
MYPAEWQAIVDIFRNSAAGLIFLQNDSIARVNQHLLDRLGFSEAELIGQSVESLFPLKDSDTFANGKLLDRRTRVRGTSIQLADSKGNAIDFHLIVNRVGTLSNTPGMIWVLQAANHRLAAADRNARLQAIVDTSPDLVCICAADTTLEYASPSFAALLGRDPQQLIGSRISEWLHREDRTALLDALARIAEEGSPGSPATTTFRIRHGSEAWRTIDAQIRNLGSEPAMGGLLLHGHDVTEETQRQNALAADKKRQLHYLNRLFQMAQRPQANAAPALKVIVKAAAKALGVHRCGYWQVEDDPAATRCVIMYDEVMQNVVKEEPEPALANVLHSLLYQVRLSEEPLAAADVDLDPRAALFCEYFHSELIKAVMLVPVRRNNRVDGILIFADRDRARAWRNDDVAFAGNVASLVSTTLDKAERAKAEAQLRHLAHQDGLTGLPNRHALFNQASELFPKITETSPTLAAFFIDLDGFTHINETLGYATGDELLKAVALRLKNVVRKDDVVVRLGGDKFMLIARNLTDNRITDDIAQQIVDTMRNTFMLQGRELQISASVGTAIYPIHGADLETLMRKADVAMVHAKSGGRDQYRTFAPIEAEEPGDRAAIEQDLRNALAARELLHYYQPQVDLRTGEVRCVEAFLRWQHPRHGMLLPAQFLPLAEASGLMHDISEWALNDACDQLNAWRERGLGQFNLALNLSACQLTDDALLPALEDALARTGVPGMQLEWEIREATVMQPDALSTALLERIADMRIGLSIDHFGSGYSNLSHLRRYPVHKVKIDRSFVNGLPAHRDHRAIADAIISMAQPLGLDVVAEGVETPEQMEYLREHGCTSAQGYYFTHPLTADQFEEWLIRH